MNNIWNLSGVWSVEKLPQFKKTILDSKNVSEIKLDIIV